MTDKSLIVLTNFWDANTLIDHRCMLINDSKRKIVYKVDLSDSLKNYSVYSIALSPPNITPKNLKNLQNMVRLDFFCPTYDILRKYHQDGDWNYYTKEYIRIIKKRKQKIVNWMNSLTPDHVYFLCCWEDTSNGSHCHRELLHDAFSQSKTARNKFISIYRHGNRKYKKIHNQYFPILGSNLDNLLMAGNYIDVTVSINDNGDLFQTSNTGNTIVGVVQSFLEHTNDDEPF